MHFSPFLVLVFFIVILFLNIALNSQNLPKWDGASYQYSYLNMTKDFSGISTQQFLKRILSGEFYQNSLNPFFSFVNVKAEAMIPSALMLGSVNVLVIFLSSAIVASLLSVFIFGQFSISTSAMFFVFLLSQKIYWALGNGWWDLRNDLGPALVVLVSYIACITVLLRGKLLALPTFLFFCGTFYIILARPPMLAFQLAATMLALLLILIFEKNGRKQRLIVSLKLIGVVTPVLLTLVPRLPGLKQYYGSANQYEAEQWPLFRTFWTNVLRGTYGSASIIYWQITLGLLACFIFKPKFFQRLFNLDQATFYRVCLLLIPAFVNFLILNLEGTYGNPYGYILLMISGSIGLTILTSRPILRGMLVTVATVLTAAHFANSVHDIKISILEDRKTISEIQIVLDKMNELSNDKPYNLIMFTVASTDCAVMRILHAERNALSPIPAHCESLVHSQGLGMETRINGRGDIQKLKFKLSSAPWMPGVQIQPSSSKITFFWTLREDDRDFKNDQAYLYSHRVADVINQEIKKHGATKVLSSALLRTDVFEVKQN